MKTKRKPKPTILAIKMIPALRKRIRAAAAASEQTESGFARLHLSAAAETILAPKQP
jgi:hypothetical protein